ncbi:hypothetical protein BJ878DRAFT_483164 [Calycina marina]|uniref:Uncharacterized protein n=1 Tax=Calycina marina TaxID=1763456 RepID=A0A9P7YWY7_9HELO|nr:hypothetical protein BJ878DRAFT_483164 [Calycina marina]
MHFARAAYSIKVHLSGSLPAFCDIFSSKPTPEPKSDPYADFVDVALSGLHETYSHERPPDDDFFIWSANNEPGYFAGEKLHEQWVRQRERFVETWMPPSLLLTPCACESCTPAEAKTKPENEDEHCAAENTQELRVCGHVLRDILRDSPAGSAGNKPAWLQFLREERDIWRSDRCAMKEAKDAVLAKELWWAHTHLLWDEM